MTGISLQSIGLGVDEGDVYSVLPVPLDGTETEASLSDRIARLVPDFVVSVLADPERKALKQVGEPTYTSFVSKEDGRIDFTAGAASIHAQIRACSQWPKAYALLDGNPLYITGVYGSVFDLVEEKPSEPCGMITAMEKGKGLKLALSDGYIHITKVLPPMRKEMDAASFFNGSRGIIGSILN